MQKGSSPLFQILHESNKKPFMFHTLLSISTLNGCILGHNIFSVRRAWCIQLNLRKT